MRKFLTCAAVVTLGVSSGIASAKEQIPALLWGADLTSLQCQIGGLCEQNGLDIEVYLENSIDQQIKDIQSGKTSWFRGTDAQALYANDRLCQDSDNCLVHVYQFSDSTGGDGLHAADGISDVSQLCGKTVGLQQGGPHLGLAITYDALAKCASGDEMKLEYFPDLGLDSKTDASAVNAFQDGKLDATFGITVDLGKLTTGKTLPTTATLRDAIKDSLYVTAQKANAEPETVQAMTRALLLSNEQTVQIAQEEGERWKALTEKGAAILFETPDDSKAIADIGDMYKWDLTMAGWTGNVIYATCQTGVGKESLTCLENQKADMASALKRFGQIDDPVRAASITAYPHDWEALKAGLTEDFGVKAPRYTAGDVARVVSQLEATGQIDDGFQRVVVNFAPNQASFELAQYEAEIDSVVGTMAKAGGSIMTINAHADPSKYLLQKYGLAILPTNFPTELKAKLAQQFAEPADPSVWKETLQAAKNTSQRRADAMAGVLKQYVDDKGYYIGFEGVTPKGVGVKSPVNGQCQYSYRGNTIQDPCFPDSSKTVNANRRVIFASHNVEGELDISTGVEW